MKSKEETIQTYKEKKVTKVFDKERSKYLYQKNKHKIESNFLKDSIKNIKQNKINVLDVACGTGRMLPEIFATKKDVEYVGLDTSKEMTDILNEKAKNLKKEDKIDIKLGDATKMPFEDNTFDLVYSFHLLWHIEQEEQKKIIKEMIRVTKPRGLIIFDILNKNFIWEFFKKGKNSEGIYKMKLSNVKKILGNKKIKIEKLNDAIIKKDEVYKIFNLINLIRKIMPSWLYHMVYVQVEKNV